MEDFIHYNARSVDEAVKLLGRHRGKAKLNAGGTDLLGVLKDRITTDYPESVINIKGIPGLDYIREDGEGLKVGALTKLAKIVDSPLVKEKYAIIAEAAKSVATPQIRNMCTIGGNLAQDVRCWYYRYPDELGGMVMCLRKGGAICNALVGDNRYHSIFGTSCLASYPCASACPANTAVPSYLAKIRNGQFEEAARIFADYNPMPAVTGRVCPAFCEPECKRNAHDDAVAVRCVERSLGDFMLENAAVCYFPPKKETGKSIAVIGSGPAGLSAAYYLRRAGHRVTVYEKLPDAGGMLFYSIPGYRLPKDVVREQITAFKRMGITFKVGTEIGKDLLLEELEGKFDAVLVSTGAWKEKPRTLKSVVGTVISGLSFLKEVNEGNRTAPGKKVAVIGGGNVAIDAARTLLRLGAKPVILYRRTVNEMPAFKDEVEKAREEGARFRFLTLPTEVVKTGGKVSLTCMKMRLGAKDESGRCRAVPKEGSEFTLAFDAVISATGEEPDYSLLPSAMRKKAVKGIPWGLLGRNVYGAGDFAHGSSTVIEAVASGREAAETINEGLGGDGISDLPVKSDVFASPSYDPALRITVSEVAVSERLKSLTMEDRGGIAAAEAEKEARRCFNCGCVAVNPSDIGVALVAAGGYVVTNKRRIDASVFFAPDAMTSTILDTDEIITEIQVPKIAEKARQHYLKFTLRKPIDFAIVSIGIVITAEDGRCTDARVALGAVAPVPFRASAAERELVGKPLTEETASAAAKAAVEGAMPLSKNGYKVQLAKTLVRRAIIGENV